jgi:hypothetical protein
MQLNTSTRPHIQAQIVAERRIAKAWRIVQIVNNTVAIYLIAITGYFITVAITV